MARIASRSAAGTGADAGAVAAAASGVAGLAGLAGSGVAAAAVRGRAVAANRPARVERTWDMEDTPQVVGTEKVAIEGAECIATESQLQSDEVNPWFR